jgi:hypothetical protein
MYKIINFPVVLYGLEEHGLRMFQSGVLRGIFGSKWDEEAEENCVMRSFIIRETHHTLLECSNQGA